MITNLSTQALVYISNPFWKISQSGLTETKLKNNIWDNTPDKILRNPNHLKQVDRSFKLRGFTQSLINLTILVIINFQ